jgi:hypothetical protein
MKEFIEQVIAKGDYKLDELEAKIKKLYILGDLTETEMDELLALAADSVDNSAQVDMFAMIVDLQHRVEALETADFPVWKAGYVTKKGEIVKIDLDGDGTLDYAMYYGGRSETSLSVGKINGWYKVTSAGVKTHTITRNSDGTYTLTALSA